MEEKTKQIVEKFFQFLAVMFGKEDMDDLEAKEQLYFIKYIRNIVSQCLEAQEIGQIPILELTIWASRDGKTNVTINGNKNPQIRDGWFLSELTKRLMVAINAWDSQDIGQKEGRVIDMMSQLGWIKDEGGTAG